jgi:hypothetical protein
MTMCAVQRRPVETTCSAGWYWRIGEPTSEVDLMRVNRDRAGYPGADSALLRSLSVVTGRSQTRPRHT